MSTAPPTWLFVSAVPGFGGHEVMLLRWLQELEGKPALLVPRLLARADSRLLGQASAALCCPPFAPFERHGRTRLLRDLALVRRTVRTLQPECVVVASGALNAHMPHVLLLRLMGVRVLVYVPLLGTFTSMGYSMGAWKDRFVRWLYAKVPRGWVAISATQAEEFQRWAQPTAPLFVLPNTVAATIEQAQRVPVRLVPDGAPLRVLVLGRLDAQQKGLDLLLEHLAHAAPADYAGLHLSLVGDGPYRARIEALLGAKPALARHVELSPWMPAQQALADTDVLLLVSRFEGVPLVMLEAMALGVPVVCSDLPGTQAYVPAACRFAVGDIAAALSLLESLRSADRRRDLADAGRQIFDAQASGHAFGIHVQQLVRSVRASFAIDGPVHESFEPSVSVPPKLPKN